ncbi:MAG: hypothetical protein A2Z03_04120 [Chloroflexi bacterium RBG_16_56_8]|nr:MAG: hypothetical protein A2Z03_04120 [Chloroflexi bacterium RBG_16_56_8]
MSGIRGGQLYEDILMAIRHSFRDVMSEHGFTDYLGVLDDHMMMSLLGEARIDQMGKPGRLFGSRVPDMLFVHEGNPVIVEVGNYNPSKWSEFPVIHVGFNLAISIINDNGDNFTRVVAVAVSRAVQSL